MSLNNELSTQDGRLQSEDEPPSGVDLRLNLSEAKLPRIMSDGPSTASTIYDPGVLAMSPEYRAVVAQRNARDEGTEDKVEGKEVQFHVASPARKTRELPLGEATIRLPEEHQVENGEEEIERELCCHGLLPLYSSLMLLNVFNIAIGLIFNGIGGAQLAEATKDLVGFGSAARLVISGSFLLPLFSVVLGCLFIFCGSLGVFANYRKANSPEAPGKVIDIAYHSLLFLISLICLVVFGLNIYSVTVRNSGPVYDTELWKNLLRSDSGHLCNLEQKLSCAGTSLGQCISENNETRHTFCPGHFCIDFCRIASDDVSVHPMCSACRQDSLESIPVFVGCKTLEKERTESQACTELANGDVSKIYGKLMIVGIMGFVWILILWIILAYVEFFL